MTSEPGQAHHEREPVTFELDQRLPLGFRFPVRMTAIPLASRGVALISPIPIDAAIADAVAELGEVRYLIAPNLLHHLYLGAAALRYPDAEVLAPSGLARKRVDLRIDRPLEEGVPPQLASEIEAIRIDGAAQVDEFAFFHRPSRTLVVTDLVFNVVRPRGIVAHVVLALVGCHGRLAQSRAWYGFSRDRAATRRSLDALARLPFETLVVAHGEIVRENARERFLDALRLLDPPRRELGSGDVQRP